MHTLFVINIVLLAAGPILLAIMAYAKHVVAHRRIRVRAPARDAWTAFKSLEWAGDLWRVAKFWLAVALGVGCQMLLITGYVTLNPFVRIPPPRAQRCPC